MNVLQEAGKALQRLRQQRPLIHHITNVVTINDCANATLAIGASPTMTWAPAEAGEMAGAASSLVLNMGTLQPWTIDAMEKAGKAAAGRGVPIVLDPVGAGGTTYRTQRAMQLVTHLPLAVIRGNVSEMMCLAAGKSGVNPGVDSHDTEQVTIEKVRRLAQLLKTTVAVTGPVDAVSDGTRSVLLGNGTSLLTYVTGTGCMTTSLIASFAAVSDPFTAAVSGILSMGIAGEKAACISQGPGTFHLHLIDALYQLQAETYLTYGKVLTYDE
jgi:hydroxyethylthiazole kinase